MNAYKLIFKTKLFVRVNIWVVKNKAKVRNKVCRFLEYEMPDNFLPKQSLAYLDPSQLKITNAAFERKKKDPNE